jgi:hypothetical protein
MNIMYLMAKDSLYFLVVYFTITLSFAFLFTMLFWEDSTAYTNIMLSWRSLIDTAFGNYDFQFGESEILGTVLF